MSNTAFKIETEGHLLSGPKVRYTAITTSNKDLPKVKRRILESSRDILSKKMLKDLSEVEEEVHVSMSNVHSAVISSL